MLTAENVAMLEWDGEMPFSLVTEPQNRDSQFQLLLEVRRVLQVAGEVRRTRVLQTSTADPL